MPSQRSDILLVHVQIMQCRMNTDIYLGYSNCPCCVMRPLLVFVRQQVRVSIQANPECARPRIACYCLCSCSYSYIFPFCMLALDAAILWRLKRTAGNGLANCLFKIVCCRKRDRGPLCLRQLAKKRGPRESRSSRLRSMCRCEIA